MPIPASFNTPDRIIRTAMLDAQLLQKGDDPNGEDYADYLPRLNDLINAWQTQGLKLWLNEIVTVPLVAGTATYSLGPAGSIIATKPMRSIEAYYLYNTGNSYPLNILAWNDYNLLSQKNQPGSLNSFFPNKQQLNIDVSFWMVPDTAAAALGTVQMLLQTSATNMVSLNDALLFPQEWFIALRWALADEISAGQPEAVITRCSAQATKYKIMLEDWDTEDAPTSFTPSGQQGMGSQFR